MKNNVILIVLILVISYFGYLIYQENNINVVSFEAPKELVVIVGEEENIDIVVKEEDNKKVDIDFISSDESVFVVSDNVIKGIKDGKAILKVKLSNGDVKNISVIVTSLITKPVINNNKDYIKCGEYSKEESDFLEKILEERINDGGYQTRMGALAAARFLLLEFKNGIRYYNENGRLENHSNIRHIDGEGRFYHKGLYLTTDKYDIISASTSDGPKMWGCTLKNINYSKEMENGLNCSGFITWALYNAGYDIKDVGAGDYSYIHNELLDLRPKESISLELLNSGKVKVGDLIGFDGHIAMIIGLLENKVYVGESYETGLRVLTFSYDELIKSDFTDIILMDDYYKNDGNLTNMW